MRPINDQRLSILETLGYVKVAAVSDDLALVFVGLDNISAKLIDTALRILYYLLHDRCLQDVRDVDPLSELSNQG